ncbi:hypothetical protein F1D05_27900 [Kribbella qitaiheensis]|uniref:Uncharacterized protein n=1 Tax=Kribbella qitaiheensis TaxID=1544730 RepID=A0A7G6X469_9ACTN|nr:hypothetical protein [Kribbella qitaiheensis]QNE21034.1 hypothetical protein F1D05_27900 [Kribbella qitaiheensis]
MSDTRTLRRHRPTAALSPAPSVARSVRPQICPADVEAALLDHYPDLVRLAYANLPPNLSRHRNVLAAHGVVQRALPDHRHLERQLAGATDAAAFVRNLVLQAAIKQADARTPLRLQPRAWAIRLLALTRAPESDDFDPCSLRAGSPNRAEPAQRLRPQRRDRRDLPTGARCPGLPRYPQVNRAAAQSA